jgi:hypothetical protein
LPNGANEGVVKLSTLMIPNGKAIQSRYGRNLPQRVRVRSATMPTMTSKNMSQVRVTSSMVASALAASP